MKTYRFKTSTTMKPYNRKKWWIMHDYVGEVNVKTNSLNEAIKNYAEYLRDKYGIVLSQNAIRNKEPMFRDRKDGESKQVGFVFTGKTTFYDDYGKSSRQFIELWTDIDEVKSIF